MSESKTSPQLWAVVTIAVAVIACCGTITAALIPEIIRNFRETPIPIINSSPTLLPDIPTNISPSTPTYQVESMIQPTQPQTTINQPPDTKNGTVLNIGETWYQNGKSITLINANLTSYAVANSEAVNVEWIFKNISTNNISIKFTEDNFYANNNIGQSVTYKRFYNLPNGNGSTVVFAPGDSIKFSIDLWIGYSDTSINSIIITVSLSDIQNARWNVPIYH